MKQKKIPVKYAAFFRSFYEAMENLPRTQRLALYEIVMEYVFNEQVPDQSKMTRLQKMGWELMLPQLDASYGKYVIQMKRAEHGHKGAEYGHLGGRPRKRPVEVEEIELSEEEIADLKRELRE